MVWCRRRVGWCSVDRSLLRTYTHTPDTTKQIEDVHLVRDKGSGKSKGFAFIKYEDQRSTVLAVDNFNGIKVRGCIMGSERVSSSILSVALLDHLDTSLSTPRHTIAAGAHAAGGPQG